jgi:hypothetical protein
MPLSPESSEKLVGLDFPLIVNAQIAIPDQAKVLKGYKSRLRKMQAVQRDSNGGFRTNVEAQVAEANWSGCNRTSFRVRSRRPS